MPALAEWQAIQERLDPDWDDVVLSFVPEQGAMNAAAGVLAPLGPGRLGRELRVHVGRGGGGVDKLENLLGRLDRKRVWGELALLEAHVKPGAARAEAMDERQALVAQWDDAVAQLPPGWRDVLAELELDSTDFLAQAALAGSPLNPSRIPGEIALRFRVVAHGAGGYGTSPAMARRCLERMDAVGVTGELRPLQAVSDVDYVATQGPVWRIAGRAV